MPKKLFLIQCVIMSNCPSVIFIYVWICRNIPTEMLNRSDSFSKSPTHRAHLNSNVERSSVDWRAKLKPSKRRGWGREI